VTVWVDEFLPVDIVSVVSRYRHVRYCQLAVDIQWISTARYSVKHYMESDIAFSCTVSKLLQTRVTRPGPADALTGAGAGQSEALPVGAFIASADSTAEAKC
jgi:hypothetical protein